MHIQCHFLAESTRPAVSPTFASHQRADQTLARAVPLAVSEQPAHLFIVTSRRDAIILLDVIQLKINQ